MSEKTKSVKKVRKSAPQVAGSFPFSPDAMRSQLLERAGFDEDKQVQLVKKVIEGIDRDLDAEKTEVIVTKSGDVYRENVQDNVARAKAREQALDLTGVRAARTNAAQTVRHVVSIEWPDFAAPAPVVIDAKPDHVE